MVFHALCTNGTCKYSTGGKKVLQSENPFQRIAHTRKRIFTSKELPWQHHCAPSVLQMCPFRTATRPHLRCKTNVSAIPSCHFAVRNNPFSTIDKPSIVAHPHIQLPQRTHTQYIAAAHPKLAKTEPRIMQRKISQLLDIANANIVQQ